MNKKYDAVLFVESPSKIKVYNNALKNEESKIKVLTTKGHLREVILQQFDTTSDNIDIQWKEKSHVYNIIKQLKEIQFDDTKDLFIATDADREGEAIGWHLMEILKHHFKYLHKPYRMCCIELNSEVIIKELHNVIKNNCTLCESLISAYKTRVTIDLILGINGSCLLWEKLYGCKSLGRVQSVSILKIFDLEQQIRKFKSEKKYKLLLQLQSNLCTKVIKIVKNNKIIGDIKSLTDAENMKDEIEAQNFIFDKVSVFEKSSHSITPLDMSSLGSVANVKLSMKVKEMYSVCQKLYEGIGYGHDTVGAITYMRTDSQYISESFKNKIGLHITNIFGQDEYIPLLQTKHASIIIQEAHEAIRPTFLMNQKDYNIFIDKLDRKERKVYQYIMFRTLASFMKPVVYEHTEYIFISENKEYNIHFNSVKVKEIGYIQLLDYYNIGFCYDIIESQNNIATLIQLVDTICKFKVDIKEYETAPPERLTESRLIYELKKHNIGRPSTYSYIVETIKTREYVKMEKNKYYITSSGCLLSIFIAKYLYMFINYDFTSKMESSLDQIARGEQTGSNIIKVFLRLFNDNMHNIYHIDRSIIIDYIEKNILTNYVNMCVKCKQKLSLRFFKGKPYVCCCCGYISPINKIGYTDEKNIPPIIEYSKNKQYIKRVQNNNYGRYGKYNKS